MVPHIATIQRIAVPPTNIEPVGCCFFDFGHTPDGHKKPGRSAGEQSFYQRKERRRICEQISLLLQHLIFPREPYQFILVGAHRLAHPALGNSTCLHSARPRWGSPSPNSEFPRHLNHRPTQFPGEPYGLGLDPIGKLTSCGCAMRSSKLLILLPL